MNVMNVSHYPRVHKTVDVTFKYNGEISHHLTRKSFEIKVKYCSMIYQKLEEEGPDLFLTINVVKLW